MNLNSIKIASSAIPCILVLFPSGLWAAPCPRTPGNLPQGSAEWILSSRGRAWNASAWSIRTSDNTSYQCTLAEWTERENDDIFSYANYTHHEFTCGILRLRLTECVMDKYWSLTRYERDGMGEDYWRRRCMVNGSRWKFVLHDKKGDGFQLAGSPEFSFTNPLRITSDCPNPSLKLETWAWKFRAGTKDIFLLKRQDFRLVRLKQPLL
jgi:hypothetical protein